jgi:phosphoglycerol transferase
MCLTCASFGSYYAFFTMVTIGMAALVVAATQRTIRPLVAAASYGAVVVAMFAFNLLPNLLYRAEHGVNSSVARRVPIEIDLYGLRLIQLLTPVPGHWLGPLRSVSEELSLGYSSAGAPFLGLTGAAALLLMVGWLAGVVVGSDRPRTGDARPLLAYVTMVWILTATTGGLVWFVTLIGFTQIRVWSRVSILLMFTSLAWLALTVAPKVRRWVRDSTARRHVAHGLAITVLVFGLADQSSASFVTKPNAYVDSFVSDKQFFTAIEQQLPTAAMVYQLPYRKFPEEPPLFGSGDYDLLRPFLQTESLRWSYGGMKGRESDWQVKLANLPADQLTRAVLAVGYEAYVIDRAGYEDHGAQIEGAISGAIGREAIQSADGRWSFFDLTGLSPRFGTASDLAEFRERLLYSPRVDLQGCSGPEGAGNEQFNWCGTNGSIHVIDPTPDESNYVLRASVIAPGGTGTLRLTVAGRTSQVAIGPRATPISLTLPPSGDIAIEFSTDVPAVIASGDPRDLRFQFVFPHVSSVT